MYYPKYEPRNTSDVVIGYLVSLTDQFLQGNWLAIIPLFLWTVLAVLIWLTIVRKLDSQSSQTKDKKVKKSTTKKPKSSKKKKRKRHR